jgi:two-component SAPR family response regulator
MERLSIDVEDLLALAERARTTPPDVPDPHGRERLLRRAMAAYAGDAFADEPYAAWAEQLRRQAHLAFFGVSHALAELVAAHGDHLGRVHLYRRVLALDPYDLPAHDGLIDSLDALGATSHAAAARVERHHRLAELGLDDLAR